MAKNEWIYDPSYKAWYYLKDDGVYVTGNHKINGKTHQFQSNGKWIAELSGTPAFEKGKYTKVIFLDPGHGGRDSGAFYYNIAEKDLNMQIYKKLRKELEGLGYTVLTSRDSDVYVDFVTERSKMVNKTNSDMFISIHFNASSNPKSKISGIETYFYEQGRRIDVSRLFGYGFWSVHKKKLIKSYMIYLLSILPFVGVLAINTRIPIRGVFIPRDGWDKSKFIIAICIALVGILCAFVSEVVGLRRGDKNIATRLKEGS